MPKIESAYWRLWIDPGRGAQWDALEARRGDDWLSVSPDCRSGSDRSGHDAGAAADRPRAGQDESTPLAAACFHMIPYSNRVRDGRFPFAGKTHALGRADKHAIHGALRKLPWRVDEASATRILCSIDSREHGDAVDWPWPIEASIEYSVEARRLTSTLRLWNRGETPMPAGLGWHPYFVRDIDGAAPRLELPVEGVFPDAAGDRLPDGAPVELPPELDFRASRALDPAQWIDCCLAELDGAVHIAWPRASLGLTMRASPACRYLVLFNPPMPHFAVEPVTNANDAFNLESRGIEAGVRVLAPGESLRATFELELD